MAKETVGESSQSCDRTGDPRGTEKRKSNGRDCCTGNFPGKNKV